MRLATILVTLIFSGIALGQTQPEPLTAYWLSDTDPTTALMYDPLLVISSVPLEQLEAIAKHQDTTKRLVESQAEFTYVLEQPAIFLETHERDSIWNQDGRPIKPFTGKLMKAGTSVKMSAYGRQYRIAPAATADVIRLLREPEGTKSLHRLHPPVAGAKRTIHVIALLLEDQAEQSLKEGRTQRCTAIAEPFPATDMNSRTIP